MKTIILAGGGGTRLQEETSKIPKPMVTVGGHPLLWHIIKLYEYYDFNDFIICAGYKQEKIKEYFLNYHYYNSDITIKLPYNTIQKHSKPIENWSVSIVDTGLETLTAGRIKAVKDYIGNERFMLTYGDGISDVNIKELLDFHNMSKSLVTITSVQSTGRFGSLDIYESGVVNSFKEKPEKESWINAGFMVCEPEIFDYLDDGDFAKVLEKLAGMKLLSAYKHTGFFQPVDVMRDRVVLEEMWENNNAPWRLW